MWEKAYKHTDSPTTEARHLARTGVFRKGFVNIAPRVQSECLSRCSSPALSEKRDRSIDGREIVIQRRTRRLAEPRAKCVPDVDALFRGEVNVDCGVFSPCLPNRSQTTSAPRHFSGGEASLFRVSGIDGVELVRGSTPSVPDTRVTDYAGAKLPLRSSRDTRRRRPVAPLPVFVLAARRVPTEPRLTVRPFPVNDCCSERASGGCGGQRVPGIGRGREGVGGKTAGSRGRGGAAELYAPGLLELCLGESRVIERDIERTFRRLLRTRRQAP